MSAADHADDLIDYEEDDQALQQDSLKVNVDNDALVEDDDKKDKKGSYVGIHSTGFRDFLLKPELLRSIVDCGFEHPSEGKERTRRVNTYCALTLFSLVCACNQSNKNVFLNLFWGWMYFVKPSLVWGKQQFSFWRRYNRSNLWMVKYQWWYCVIPVNWPSKSRTNTLDSANISLTFALECFMAVSLSLKTLKH
jgi:hypothetical protein